MDKRTLIFSLCVFATFFGVNTYFNHQHEEKLKEWTIEQNSKKAEKLKNLDLRIAEETTSAEELHLTPFYSDKSSKSPIGEAVYLDNALFTTSWNVTPPKTVYLRDEKGAEETFTLTHDANKIGELLIYQSESKKPLLIGNLPDIGHIDLQLVTFHNGKAEEPTIQLAEYHDGVFTTLSEQQENLKASIDTSYKKKAQSLASGLVLMQSKSRYQPVGIYDGKLKSFTSLEDLVSLKGDTTKGEATSQEFYVLENDYQQLVISNVGGSLIEINLPFNSNVDQASVVKPIGFDTDMKKEHPYNAYFPAHPYFTAGPYTEGPFTKHEEGKLGGYYPLIRRDLTETAPWKSVTINPRYYALNLLSEQPDVSELVYTVKHFDATTLILEAEQKRRRITKTYKLPKDGAPYTFDLSIKIDGDRRGLWLTSGIPEVELFSGNSEPVLKYRITRGNKPAVEMITLPQESTTNSSIHPDWLCNSNGFFGIIMDPLNEVTDGFKATYVSGQTVPSRLVEIDQEYNRFPADTMPGYQLMVPIKSDQKVTNMRIFAGPLSNSVLKSVDAAYADPTTGYSPDYIASQSYHGFFSFISEPFAKFLFVLMNFFHRLSGSWALSIILLTVALRIMMYPLNNWSTKSMVKMQQIAPQVAAIQERNKKDPVKAQKEIVELYREKGVNPISGCFPMLIQLPFLIGMFDLLKSTFELRGASFIPGWIDNLAAPDVLFSWGKPLFFIGNQFHLLPFILGGVMYLQQRMSQPAITDPSKMTDQQRQQRTMMTLMPVIFTFMFYHFPSGLNIYWLSSMLLGMLQQWWTQRKLASEATKPTLIIPKKEKK